MPQLFEKLRFIIQTFGRQCLCINNANAQKHVIPASEARRESFLLKETIPDKQEWQLLAFMIWATACVDPMTFALVFLHVDVI